MNMKNLNFLLFALLLASPSLADEDNENNQPQFCTAVLEDIDGNVNEWVRVDCDGPYAGKCLKETYTDSSKKETYWREVECK